MNWIPASRAVERANTMGFPITLKWLTRDASKHAVRTRPRQLPGKHKVEVEWGSLDRHLRRRGKPNRSSEEDGCSQEEAAQRIQEAKEHKRKNRSAD
jgi:hypothetical protein